ncbi:MAG TPA: hypothetical protein VFA10_27120 [Ktedonobacteraceae bacterium]|nr:hypothetical protein [Ktedonobacteraceae bacterium]
MTQHTSSDYPLKRWHQKAAGHPGFIGYGLRLLRERTPMTEEQQRTALGIPTEAAYNPVWLTLQALSFPRAANFEHDVQRIAEYVVQKAQEQNQLAVALDSAALVRLLTDARKEMALKLSSLQPFAVVVQGVGTFFADEMRSGYLVYLPEGVDEATIELNIAPSGGGDFVFEWTRRIRSCPDDEQAAKLLTSYSLTLSEAMTNRMLDSMSDLLGVPRTTSE